MMRRCSDGCGHYRTLRVLKRFGQYMCTKKSSGGLSQQHVLKSFLDWIEQYYVGEDLNLIDTYVTV